MPSINWSTQHLINSENIMDFWLGSLLSIYSLVFSPDCSYHPIRCCSHTCRAWTAGASSFQEKHIKVIWSTTLSGFPIDGKPFSSYKIKFKKITNWLTLQTNNVLYINIQIFLLFSSVLPDDFQKRMLSYHIYLSMLSYFQLVYRTWKWDLVICNISDLQNLFNSFPQY